jgi:hypothetical protein
MLPVRLTGRRQLAAILATAGVMAVVAPSALADRLVGLNYTIDGLGARTIVMLTYGAGATVQSDGVVQATTGSLSSFNYLSGGMIAYTGDDPTNLTALQIVKTDASKITGQARLPGGASVTVHNDANDQTTVIRNGEFSIPLTPGVRSRRSTVGHSKIVAGATASAGSCRGISFTVLHNDQSGGVTLPNGSYIVSSPNLGCLTASNDFTTFLDRYNHAIPGWAAKPLASGGGTFTKNGSAVQFTVKRRNATRTGHLGADDVLRPAPAHHDSLARHGAI